MSQLLISQNGGTLQVQQTQNNAREEVIGKIMREVVGRLVVGRVLLGN
jgi:hypothetical protein